MAQSKGKSQSERAVDAWNVLIRQATERQEKIAYSEVSEAIGYGSPRIGKILHYIQEYCKLRSLPKLTVLVIEKGTGTPGSGMDPHTEVDYREVFSFDWRKLPIPTPDEFEEAVRLDQGHKPTLKFQNIRNQIAPFSRKKDDESS